MLEDYAQALTDSLTVRQAAMRQQRSRPALSSPMDGY